MEDVFKPGDKVRHKKTGLVYTVEITYRPLMIKANRTGEIEPLRDEAIEFEPVKPLTPEDAWAEAVLLIIEKIDYYRLPLVETEMTAIRHECYKLLGGSGVNVNENKQRVRGLIEKCVTTSLQLRGH